MVWFNVPLNTFRSFGDGGVTEASARIVAAASPTVCAVLSSVCAITVDNSGVYVYYLKALCPYISDAQPGLCVYLEHAFTCVSTTLVCRNHHLLSKLKVSI